MYCQGNFVYGNSDDADAVCEYDNGDGINMGVYGEAIKIIEPNGEWYLGYSEGADEDGIQNFIPMGTPINYCPNCGRRLNKDE